ncbi:MAG: Fic family protein [Campylobacterota bacterium]|nr:Fic family protein [Campylobacterota bacterium]
MDFTPIVPTDLSGQILHKHLNTAEEICIKSAALKGSHNQNIINEIISLLRVTNSYYSNRIESEGTHPIDIDRAMKNDFYDDEKKRVLQKLSLAHIEVQKQIENHTDHTSEIYENQYILDIHKQFYTQDSMEFFLNIQYEDLKAKMTPGTLRDMDVTVGSHLAPPNDNLISLLTSFDQMYNQSKHLSKSQQLIYALCSHHKLVWIHPFLDGNGRVSRLFLDYLLFKIKIDGYGLWNISRGLARNVDKYKEMLQYADMVAQGSQDGRGALSNRGLSAFLDFMLEVTLDQVDYMTKYLKIDSLGNNIEKYVKLSQSGLFDNEPLPKYSELIFKELLIKGNISRGEVSNIIGKGTRTATTLVSKLIKADFLQSKSHKDSISLKFNSHFASYIIPELMPQR